MLISRFGCLLPPGKASYDAPRLADELLYGTSASSHPVKSSTTHGVSSFRQSFNPLKYGMLLWSPAPYIDLSSGLLLLKPSPPAMSSLLQIILPSPDNHRRMLHPTRSTIMESDFLLVGLVSFDGPLTFQQTRPTTKKSRSYLHCNSTDMCWVREDQSQSLIQSFSPTTTLYPSSKLLGNLLLVSDQIYGVRKDDIMTPPLRSGGYRHLLNPLILYPVFPEPYHVQYIFIREGAYTLVAPSLKLFNSRYDYLYLLLTSISSRWCGQDYELYDFHLSSNSSLLLWCHLISFRILVIVTPLAPLFEPFCLNLYGSWILNPSCPSYGYGFGLSKVISHHPTMLPNSLKHQSIPNLAQTLVKLLLCVDLLKPVRSFSFDPFTNANMSNDNGYLSSIDLFMEESVDNLDLTCIKLPQNLGSKLSRIYCRLIISLVYFIYIMALGNAFSIFFLSYACMNFISFE